VKEIRLRRFLCTSLFVLIFFVVLGEKVKGFMDRVILPGRARQPRTTSEEVSILSEGGVLSNQDRQSTVPDYMHRCPIT